MLDFSCHNIVIFGSTDLSLSVCNELVRSKAKIKAIVTLSQQFKISYSEESVNNFRQADLCSFAHQNKIPLHLFETNTKLEFFLKEIECELAFVVGWYHFIPSRVRIFFLKGCYAFHASLLPKFRGGAPLNWSLLLGETETGVTLFEMTDAIDDGPIILIKRFLILPDDYISDLIYKSEIVILEMIRFLFCNHEGERDFEFSSQKKISYSGQRKPSDSFIDWSQSTDIIYKLIRASSHPYGGAYSFYKKRKIIIWRAEKNHQIDVHGACGQIFSINELPYPVIKTADGSIMISNATDSVGEDVSNLLKKANQSRLDTFL